MLTDWGSFHSKFAYRDDAGVRIDYLGVVGTSAGKRMTVDEARAYDLDDYYTRMRNETLQEVRPINNAPASPVVRGLLRASLCSTPLDGS